MIFHEKKQQRKTAKYIFTKILAEDKSWSKQEKKYEKIKN